MHVLTKLCAVLLGLVVLNALTLVASKKRSLHLRGTIPEQQARNINEVVYSVNLSKQEFKLFPGGGGRIKPLDPTQITSNTMGFAYLELFPGGVRELHWHPLSAEWTYVIEGSCALNVMNNDGQYTNGVAHAGDVWYFAKSFGHTLQGLDSTRGCKMVGLFHNRVLVCETFSNLTQIMYDALFQALFFDAPHTPVYNDLAISEMMKSFPVGILSKNLNTPEDTINTFPGELVLVTQGPFPPPMITESTNPLPNSPMFSVENGLCRDLGQGGYIYEVKKDMFPASDSMSGGFIHLEKGSMREIHWHPNADEMHYVISGSLKVSVYGVGGQLDTYVIEKGDIGFVPEGFAHYLEAISGPADFLVTFNHPEWKNQELSTWMAVTPSELTVTSLQTTQESVAGFPKSTELFYGKEFKGCPRRHHR